MARADKFAQVEGSMQESLAEAASAPAGIRGSGADRLAALRSTTPELEEPTQTPGTPEPAPPSTPKGATAASLAATTSEAAVELTVVTDVPMAPSEPREAPPEPVAIDAVRAVKKAKPKTTLKPGTLPATATWEPRDALDHHAKHDGELDRYTYTAPKGLLDALRDLDLRAKALGLPTLSRREIATEVAKRILADPDAATAIYADYPWTKGGGQLQPIYSVELATRLDRTLAQHRVRQPGPLVGVITAQVVAEVAEWLTRQEEDAAGE